MLCFQIVSYLSDTTPPARAQSPRPTSHAPTAAGVATRLPFYSRADFAAERIAPGTAEYARIHHIAPFSLRNQEGEPISEQTLRGKIYVANFFFSSSSPVSPQVLATLRRIQDAYAADPGVLLVSHSVTPSVDSIDVLAEHAAKHGLRAGKWHLLTGPQDTIYDLAHDSYFAAGRATAKNDPHASLHSEDMLLIDGSGRIRGVYNATLPLDAERVVEDIRTLKQE